MTTIAITETEIAADGLKLFSDLRAGTDHKKVIESGEAVYAFAGVAALMEHMIKWYNDGADVDKLPDKMPDDWQLIVITKENGIHRYTSSCPYMESFVAPIAFGAGADYALGALWHGASAREAIQYVCDNTYHTGGTVTSIDITRFLAPLKEAAE